MELFMGIMIPFLGTCLGSASVFFLKNELKPLVQKGLLGFASGVMVAASVWSLLIPAMDMSKGMGKLAFLPAAVGFLLGIFFLLAMDRLIPHLHLGESKPGLIISRYFYLLEVVGTGNYCIDYSVQFCKFFCIIYLSLPVYRNYHLI